MNKLKNVQKNKCTGRRVKSRILPVHYTYTWTQAETEPESTGKHVFLEKERMTYCAGLPIEILSITIQN
jgi:hypothetical protein